MEQRRRDVILGNDQNVQKDRLGLNLVISYLASCGSSRIWKDGFRKTSRGRVQRWICRDCGYRFIRPKMDFSSIKYKNSGRDRERRLSMRVFGDVENLAGVEKVEKRSAGLTGKSSAEIRGKIIEFLWFMKKQGYRPGTIECKVKTIKSLVKRGADLYDPESVKEVIAKQTWKDSTKSKVVDDYGTFLTMEGMSWDPPKYKRISQLPFIPSENELDQLIAGSGKKMACFLQGLKETGADPGELWRLEWMDLDFERRIVRINHPVKGHNARILPISDDWISMLSKIRKRSDRVFRGSLQSHGGHFRYVRKRLTAKLGNPRLMKISFRTFRHWKGTMEYHYSKDIIHVKTVLGHKNIQNTMIYIHLEQALFQASNDEFHVRVAETFEEASELIEAGFEKADEIDGVHIYRKRK